MAHAYAARLGCIAMAFGLIKQILNDGSIIAGVMNGLGLLVVFSIVGFIIGATAEILIRQSLEANFRKRIENYRMQAKAGSAKTA